MDINFPAVPTNITLVSKDYYEKNLGKYKNYKLEFFLGKFVKKTFREEEKTEHMWVKINEVKENELIGQLDNDPFFLKNIKRKDIVSVKLNEILHYL